MVDQVKPSPELLRDLPPLDEVKAFFCFIRSWWEGAGIDAGIWWQDASGCFSLQIQTGETSEVKSPRVKRQQPLDAARLSAFLDEAVAIGLGSIPQQTERLLYGNYDVWFGMKPDAAGSEHWLRIRGGRPGDPRAEKLRDRSWDLFPLAFKGFRR